MSIRKIMVELEERSYPIYLGRGHLGMIGKLCKRHNVPDRIVVLADRNSGRVALKRVLPALRREGFNPFPIVMPAGEQQKSLKRAEAIHSTMLGARIPRRAAVLALGGGVVGDVAGFVASTYRRGLMLVQCPTTLLSMVDSSVGGKNGVNYPQSKNAIGTFHQPALVLSDVDLLTTLPRREIISGLGEVLKYPFVGAPDLLDYIESNLERILRVDPGCILQVASRCLEIKTEMVSLDEKELFGNRGRVFLNVGHAVGHTLESLSSYRLRHGEGVLLGVIIEGSISVRRGWLSQRPLDRIISIYHRLKCRFGIRGISDRTIMRHVLKDGKTRFALPGKFGSVRVVNDVTERELLSGLKVVRDL